MSNERYSDDLRFLKRRNVANTAQVYRNMVSDYIRANGVDCIYYRRGYTNFDGNEERRTSDPIYGADPTAPYVVKASMVVFMEVMADSYLLNRFGIQSEAEVQAYIGIDDFVEKFKPYIGKVEQRNYSTKVGGTVDSGIVRGIIDADEVYGEVIGEIPKSIGITGSATLTGLRFRPLRRPKDKSLFFKSHSYDLGSCRYSMFSAQVKIDESSGKVRGVASGSISHPIDCAENQSSNYRMRPQVGDLLVLDNPDTMLQDKYEITRVDRRSLGSGLVYNPLLDAYCYIVTCVQHRDSYEEVKADTVIQDDVDSVLNAIGSVPSKNELESDDSPVKEESELVDKASKKIYDYSQNGDKDNEYGGY